MDMRVFVSARNHTDFSDADLELAALLQPLLAGLYRQAAALHRWQTAASTPVTDDPIERMHDVRLTAREMAVLSLLAEGLTAAAIAGRLRISPRTVSKHQEHIYAKLHTTDRLTTVQRAQQLGLIPANRGPRVVGDVVERPTPPPARK
jgi:DNA-binding NarL/FixJ family response regulator